METQKTFTSFKKYLVEAGKEKGACAEEYRKLLKSENMEELFQVVKTNLNWCCDNEIINSKILLENVELEELNSLGFYVSQEIKELNGNQIVWLFDSQVSVMRDNSQVSVMRGNSQVSVMRDNSQVSEMWGNSQVSVMRDNSQVSEMSGNSQVSVMRDNSQVSEMWGNSQVSEMWDNSQVSVMRGNSQVSEMMGNSTRREFKTSTPKIYFKKGAFEVVTID